jgi:hypothetical protein
MEYRVRKKKRAVKLLARAPGRQRYPDVPLAAFAIDIKAFLNDIASGKLTNLALQMPAVPPGCLGKADHV